MSKLCLQPAIQTPAGPGGRGLQPKGIRILRNCRLQGWHQSCWKWFPAATIKGPSASLLPLSQCDFSLTWQPWPMGLITQPVLGLIYPRELSQRLEALSAPCKGTDGLVMSALDVGTVLDWQPHIMLGSCGKRNKYWSWLSIRNGLFFF